MLNSALESQATNKRMIRYESPRSLDDGGINAWLKSILLPALNRVVPPIPDTDTTPYAKNR